MASSRMFLRFFLLTYFLRYNKCPSLASRIRPGQLLAYRTSPVEQPTTVPHSMVRNFCIRALAFTDFASARCWQPAWICCLIAEAASLCFRALPEPPFFSLFSLPIPSSVTFTFTPRVRTHTPYSLHQCHACFCIPVASY